ncbi:MAG: GNAT family N-acetyltransferase [Alphaproteobacteria bacterium]|nr:GNAT family N-acetyltransferase [Alphaproteobacteria bacterium]MBV9692758.1 GNAT family N-acetyltransferase [Alphaproteobacteria bacterium]
MSDVTFRLAEDKDLAAIVALLADDEFAENREQASPGAAEGYAQAFAAMQGEHFNKMLLAEQDGQVVGALQLVFVPGLSRKGTKRAIIESVRVASRLRGHAIGTALMKEAIRRAREGGCGLVQLTSDKRRTRAHLFYRRLGFEQSHFGFKKEL